MRERRTDKGGRNDGREGRTCVVWEGICKGEVEREKSMVFVQCWITSMVATKENKP